MKIEEFKAIEAAYKALCVVYLDPRIGGFLRMHDMKAFEQVDRACKAIENNIEGIAKAEGRNIDFELQHEGNLSLLRPLTPAAWEWIEYNIPSTEAWQWHGDGLAIEHRDVGDIVRGISDDCLNISYL